MRDAFFDRADALRRELRAGEVLLCGFAGERSDFVRFNHGKVRQAGSVAQGTVSLRLVHQQRQAAATVAIGGPGDDLRPVLQRLREALHGLPPDPWLLINEEPQSTASERRGALAAAEDVVGEVVRAARGRDLVGFYAGGTICRGFASSLGQKNWHEVDSFNFDWSLYLREDKAVKTGYAGFDWQPAELERAMERAAADMALLDRPPRHPEPGEYRAYLGPRAMEELFGLLCWGGFSAKARATRQSPLLRMQEGEALSPKVTLVENTAGGIAPGFQGEGFVKPPRVTLVNEGRLAEALVSPRSAKEFGLTPNGAGGGEAPESLEVAAGALDEEHALAALGDGLYIGNLWYLNYSDRPAGRITGMTRFATFWVEGGRIAAPVTPLRFDDSIYRILGENLVDLTRERPLMLDPSTYEARSTSSARLPGALVAGLRFTL
jgi:predicted Zn-dependent protease